MALKKRLFIDMDGTLAVFKPVDTLERLYEPGYFKQLEPIRNVLDAVKIIKRDAPEIEVNILSAYLSDSPYALGEKNAWLNRYLPEIGMKNRIFSPCGADKKAYIPGSAHETDYLLDDYTYNLQQWEPPAHGIKLLNGINHTRGTWQHDRLRFDKSPQRLADDIISIINVHEQIRDEKPYSPPKEAGQGRGKNTVVVNAFGGPGAGKTTACFDIVSEFKKRGYVADYVPEYATELVWDNKLFMLDGTEEHQKMLFNEQKHRIDRLLGKVDFVVTDSPLLLNNIYGKRLTPEFKKMVRDAFSEYNNFSFFIERDDRTFTQKGRIHNLAESKVKDREIRNMLSSYGIYYGTYTHKTVDKIIDNSVVTYNRTSRLRQSKGLEEDEKPYEPEQKKDPIKEYCDRLKPKGQDRDNGLDKGR